LSGFSSFGLDGDREGGAASILDEESNLWPCSCPSIGAEKPPGIPNIRLGFAGGIQVVVEAERPDFHGRGVFAKDEYAFCAQRTA
jgi:hypothetical protein